MPFLLLRRTMTSTVVIACGFVTRIHGEGEYKQSVLNTMGGGIRLVWERRERQTGKKKKREGTLRSTRMVISLEDRG